MSRIMLRNSERQTFKKCRHRWQWTYRDGLQDLNAPRALRFGDLIHRSLDPYYKPGRKRGPAPAATFERLYHEQAKALGDRGFDVFSDEKWGSALDLGVGMLEAYVREYASADQEYEVIASEQTFQLRLKLADGLPFWIVGTFDGVWRHLSSGRVCFKEFKTASAINLNNLALDEQAGLYWTYGPRWLRMKKILKDGELPSSILYTFLRKAIRNPDFAWDEQGHRLNKDGTLSKVQPAAFFARAPVYRDLADRERMHNRVLGEMSEIIQARRGDLYLYKNPGPLHMPNCQGCSVKEACEVHESGGDFASVLGASMIRWDPYAAHELPERS